MRSLKEKGWKPVSNDTLKIYNIYGRLYVWVATLASQPYKTSVHLFFFKNRNSIFNILLSYLQFSLIVPVSFNFSWFRLPS